VPTYVNPYAIKEGNQHQAVVPEGPCALPSQPDAREARYLTAPVYTPAPAPAAGGATGAGAAAGTQRQGSFGQWLQQPLLAAAGLAGSSRAAGSSSGANPALTQLAAGQFRRQYQAAGSGGARRALLAEWVDKADGVLGPQLAEVGAAWRMLRPHTCWLVAGEEQFGVAVACAS
jgi:hypothetical protein